MTDTVHFQGHFEDWLKYDVASMIAKICNLGVTVLHEPQNNSSVIYKIPVGFVQNVLGIQSRLPQTFETLYLCFPKVEMVYARQATSNTTK